LLDKSAQQRINIGKLLKLRAQFSTTYGAEQRNTVNKHDKNTWSADEHAAGHTSTMVQGDEHVAA